MLEGAGKVVSEASGDDDGLCCDTKHVCALAHGQQVHGNIIKYLIEGWACGLGVQLASPGITLMIMRCFSSAL